MGSGLMEARTPSLESLQHEFDAVWYLDTYPDVREQKLDGWKHFVAHGHREGRLPRQLRAQHLERLLWSPYSDSAAADLEALAHDPQALHFERSYACWALGSWFAKQRAWAAAHRILALHFSLGSLLPGHTAPVSLLGVAAVMAGQSADAFAASNRLRSGGHFALVDMLTWHMRRRAMAAPTSEAMQGALGQASFAGLNRIYQAHGLQPVQITGIGAGFTALRDANVGAHAHPERASHELVSVLMAVRDSAQTLDVALASVLRQTWPSIELIVVDDGSVDNSPSILQQALQQENLRPGISVQIWRHEHSLGAYRARNTALKAATGNFITVHDADDWSHPQKLERQVRTLLESPSAAASISHWVRVNHNLELASWFPEPTCVHRNLSSLMIRADVATKLGFWDSVKFAADSEYFDRIQRAYGPGCIADVNPGIPLSFGLQHSNSITQGTQSHISGTVSGVRHRYSNLYRRWHERARSAQDLYIPYAANTRPFPAPAIMTGGLPCATVATPEDSIESSDIWDENWYLARYPDIANYPAPPLLHYLRHGALERRDPGPTFSASAYQALYGNDRDVGNALLDFLAGDGQRRETLPVFEGQAAHKAGARTLLLAGHQSMEQVFGAERCLLDTAVALSAAGYNLVVTLPSVGNRHYLAELLRYSGAVAIIPDMWRRHGCSPAHATLAHFVGILTRYRIDAVHVNTVVQQASVEAAKLLGTPVVVHAHELPCGDPELCATIGLTPDALRDLVVSYADVIVANSPIVKRFFEVGTTPVRLVQNAVRDVEALAALPSRPSTDPLVVAMLSSNTSKKGVVDLAAVAEAFRSRHVPTTTRAVNFVLYGPRTALVDEVLARAQAGQAPVNLRHGGYVDHPADALKHIDVLVNLSHVQESFGQSVAEALVAGKPCVVYAHGALLDIVHDGINGYHVEPGETGRVVERIGQIASDPIRYRQMSQAGRAAAATFSFAAFQRSMTAVYQDLLPP